MNCFYYFDLYCCTKSVIVISSGNTIVFLQERIMKEEKRGGRSATRLHTKLKLQNFPMLDVLLKINRMQLWLRST